jgi:hypothetical protein
MGGKICKITTDPKFFAFFFTSFHSRSLASCHTSTAFSAALMTSCGPLFVLYKRIDAADEEEEEEEEDEEDEEDEDDLFSTATIWKNDLMLVFLTFFTA